MAKDPAFLFYYQDFLVGTEFMSNQEVGCYIRILCHMADKGRLKENQLKAICRGDGFADDLKCKFLVDENGLYYHQRLESEMEKRRLYSISRSKNRTSNKKIRKSYVRHMENENRNENEDKKSFGEEGLVLLTSAEHGKLLGKLGERKTAEYIGRLENYIGSKGRKYKSHYHTILSWVKNEPTTGRFDSENNPMNLNKTQQSNLEALNDFLKRKGTAGPKDLRAGDGDVIRSIPGV